MDFGVSLFELVAPLVMLLFAFGFFSVWRVNKAEASPGWLCTSYIFAAGAFLFEFLRHVLPGIAYVPLTNGFYILTASTFAIGMSLRSNNKPQYALIVTLGVATLTSILILAMLGYGTVPRTMTAHLGNGLIFGVGVYGMRGPSRGAVDRVIFSLSVFNVVQLIVMPLGFALFYTLPNTLEEYRSHSFLTSFQLIISCAAVSVAMLLLIDYAAKVITRYRDEATHDKLTGILNRRGFEEQAGEILRKADAEGHEVCFIIADIDFFKKVNDTYGHGFGDDVIQAFGRLFGGHVQGEGCAGRLGGEEFAMIRPIKSLDEARNHAELLRLRWERISFETEGVTVSFAASFGVAIRMQNEPITSALVRADDALYLAKSSGRNCTRCQEDMGIAALKMAGNVMRKDDTPETPATSKQS